MFVGEIGIPRREFLYEIQFWEARRIIRGYNNRHHPGWEQARLVAYNAHYCMGLPKGEVAPTVTEWIKFPWEKEDVAPISDEDRAELLAEMDAINAQLAAQGE
jgi:hypothetical protein